MFGMEPLVDRGIDPTETAAVPARPGIAISRASEMDIPAIVRIECLRSKALTPEAEQRRKGFVSKVSAVELRSLIENRRDLVLISRNEVGISGILIAYSKGTANRTYEYLHPFTHEKRSCFLRAIAVNLASEGRWVSAALLREFKSWMKQEGLTEFLTETNLEPENSPALALIRRAKLTEIARVSSPEDGVQRGLFRGQIV